MTRCKRNYSDWVNLGRNWVCVEYESNLMSLDPFFTLIIPHQINILSHIPSLVTLSHKKAKTNTHEVHADSAARVVYGPLQHIRDGFLPLILAGMWHVPYPLDQTRSRIDAAFE